MRSRIQVRIERELASVQAEIGVVPDAAARAIGQCARIEFMELDELDAQNQHTGYPIATLVRQIVGACGEHGRYVHWGATTQDILNTALAMQANEAFNLLAQDLRAIIARLAALTNEHRDTLMVARTFGGHALPITFGFKVAVWLSAGLRHAERLEVFRRNPLEGEFAGAAGSLASLLIAEKADGEASFKSVFTGESADKVTPRLPRGPALTEPVVAKGEEYLVKPDKGEKPVPKHSRRALLAKAATDGTSDLFARNGANRLWAHVFGRGLVHLVDFIHPDNPPTHPAVLDLVTREFQTGGYDIRKILRALVLTRTYQTTYLLPAAKALPRGQAAKRLTAWEAELKSLNTALTAAEDAAKKKTEAVTEVRRVRTLVRARERQIEEGKEVVEFEILAGAG